MVPVLVGRLIKTSFYSEKESKQLAAFPGVDVGVNLLSMLIETAKSPRAAIQILQTPVSMK